MADKKAYHPNGTDNIWFREKYHTYTDNLGTIYTSGTSFSKPFFLQFNAIEISIKCSKGNNPKYSGRSPEEIRAEWAAEGKRGSSEGDNAHEYAEGVMSGWELSRLAYPISERCLLLFCQVRRIADFLLKKYVFVAAEMIVFSPELKIAGMVDLIMWDPIAKEILIIDWKNNKNTPTTINTFQSGLPPIDHLQQTDINKFSLQLSLYQYIIIKENYFPDAVGYRRVLIHLTPTDAIPIKLEYFEYEITELLKYDKRI